MRQPTRLGHHDNSLESPVRICRFAGQFQYLAVGYDSGTIEVIFCYKLCHHPKSPKWPSSKLIDVLTGL
jgi:hypothetical protein